MSQAHYLLCEDEDCLTPAVAALGYPGKTLLVCLERLNTMLDYADLARARLSYNGGPWFDAEPLSISWCWDAGTRTCPLHHWPDVVCRDWSAEHAAMIRALLTPTGG